MLLGTLTAFTAYMWQFYQPIMALCDLNETLQQSVTAAERVFEVLDTRPEVKDAPGAEAVAIQGRIDFDHVGFRYQESDSPDPVLSDISFTVQPGELVGIVGHSGSGKTTLVNLLLRFYDVTEGAIKIDGRDLRKIQSRCLREQISIVLQEPFLFTGTIADNIAYGRPNAGRADRKTPRATGRSRAPPDQAPSTGAAAARTRAVPAAGRPGNACVRRTSRSRRAGANATGTSGSAASLGGNKRRSGGGPSARRSGRLRPTPAIPDNWDSTSCPRSGPKPGPRRRSGSTQFSGTRCQPGLGASFP